MCLKTKENKQWLQWYRKMTIIHIKSIYTANSISISPALVQPSDLVCPSFLHSYPPSVHWQSHIVHDHEYTTTEMNISRLGGALLCCNMWWFHNYINIPKFTRGLWICLMSHSYSVFFFLCPAGNNYEIPILFLQPL